MCFFACGCLCVDYLCCCLFCVVFVLLVFMLCLTLVVFVYSSFLVVVYVCWFAGFAHVLDTVLGVLFFCVFELIVCRLRLCLLLLVWRMICGCCCCFGMAWPMCLPFVFVALRVPCRCLWLGVY